jgi:glycosyltransferase involved in cell wall biosynthesis
VGRASAADASPSQRVLGMKRVLVVLDTSGWAAQDQVRGTIYQPYFAEQGIKVRYVGYHPAPPLGLMRAGSRWAQHVVSSIEYKAAWWTLDTVGTRVNHRRIARLAAEFDVVHLIKIRSLPLIRELRARSGARLVYDLGDALWLPHHAVHYRDIVEILRQVDAVTCDNEYGLAYARQHNPVVFEWRPPSQVELFDQARQRRKQSKAGDELVIGWIGSPGTAFNLYVIWEALERVFEAHSRIHLRIVGAGPTRDRLPNFENVSLSVLPTYTRREMIDEVLNMDIGLFPMFDVFDSKTRGILKALIYMSGEAAVVCSPRGKCVDLITDGVNGLLADSRSEWIEKLGALIDDGDLRRRLVAAGLETARTGYSLRESFEDVRAALAV